MSSENIHISYGRTSYANRMPTEGECIIIMTMMVIMMMMFIMIMIIMMMMMIMMMVTLFKQAT